MKACSAGEAVTAETRPVEQAIYFPTEFRSPRFTVPSLSLQQTATPAVRNREDSRNSSDSPLMFQGSERTEIVVPPSSASRSIFLIPYRRRRTRRERARVDLDDAVRNAHAVSGDLLGERRRRAAIRQSVLVTVPWAGHIAVDDAPLADRPILMGAKIGERPDLRPLAEDRNALAVGRRDDTCALVWNRERWPDREPAFAAASADTIARPFAPSGQEMEHHHASKAACQHCRDERIAVVLHDAERHMHHDEPIGGVNRHVQSLPDSRREEDEPIVVAGCRHQEQYEECDDTQRFIGETDELAIIGNFGQFVVEVR